MHDKLLSNANVFSLPLYLTWLGLDKRLVSPVSSFYVLLSVVVVELLLLLVFYNVT